MMHAQSAASTTAGFGRSPFVASAYANPFAGMVSSSSSSSSSSADVDALIDGSALGHFDLKSSQPPPRRRYGRPNYSDKNTNPDGSSKWTGMVGGGLGLPVGNTHKYETPSWGLQVGGGRNFSKALAVLLQFDYDHFGLQSSTINNQEYAYNYYCTPAQQNAGNCSIISNLDGNNHVWSLTVDPTFTVPTEGSLGLYAVVGAGFYHKVTNFTVPSVGQYCDYFSCYQYQADQVIDHYTSNAFGGNAGLGLTWKFSRFSNEKLYAEARYVLIDNQPRVGVTAQNVSTFGATYGGYNYYPANSNRTSYIPIKFGIRF
ncbi:MAG TPA: hypothetical protein VII58_04630 [Acidobacteriaceae bacterium]